jgi:hypothetical protein
MTPEDVMAHIIVLEGEVVKLQNRLRDLYLQIREDSERASSPLDNPSSDAVECRCGEPIGHPWSHRC